MKAVDIALTIIILVSNGYAFANDFNPGRIFVDRGACPGEWCAFGNWMATKDIPVYKEPRDTRYQVGVIKKEQTVRALTGNAYVKPQRYMLNEQISRAEKENIIWVLTYEGEGYFKVWNNGKIQSMELGFSPYGPDILLPYEEEWWVKFRLPNGVIGWAKVKGGFRVLGENPH